MRFLVRLAFSLIVAGLTVLLVEAVAWRLSRGDAWVRLAPDLGYDRDFAMLLEEDGAFAPNPGIESFGVDMRPIRPRPAGVRRIVVLGGSAARGLVATTGTELVEQSFARRLDELLDGRICGEVEVVNLAVPGFGSARVRTMARNALRLEPDLIVAYMGHNEFIEIGRAHV